MKISYVRFKTIEKFGNASTTELTSDDFGELSFDPSTQIVSVGKELFPVSAIARMRGCDKDEVCPECGSTFINVSGLAAHRNFKHSVAGVSASTKQRNNRKDAP